jgi:predicted Zn-dependent protease
MNKFKYFNLIILFIFFTGCASSTKNTESDISRLQLFLLPEFLAQSMSEEAYTQNLDKAKEKRLLNNDEKMLSRVRNIAHELINETSAFRDDAIDWNWEINIKESEEVNAYCMPGGKIMVLTGLINKLKATDDEIAAILGHEIAHALREHGRERMSISLVQQLGILGFSIYISNKSDDALSKQTAVQGVALGTTLFFALPNSREQERESDKIGVELSARAGYNPMSAVSIWRKMNELSDAKVPEFLSTHPSSENRIKDIQNYVKEINHLYLKTKK